MKKLRFILSFLIISNLSLYKATGQCPTVTAGIDQFVCPGDYVTLDGFVSDGSPVNWSGGTGIFIPNNTSLTAVYQPSAAECAAGLVILQLGPPPGCPSSKDDVVIQCRPIKYVFAGPDQLICTTAQCITVAGSMSNASSSAWTTSGTGSFTDVTALSTSYCPSPIDIINNNLVLTLTANGFCASVSDDIVITFNVCASIANASQRLEFKVYPIPANKIINVELLDNAEAKEITILNTLQNIVIKKAVQQNENTTTLDLTKLSPGIYFIKVSDGNFVGLQKIIIE